MDNRFRSRVTKHPAALAARARWSQLTLWGLILLQLGVVVVILALLWPGGQPAPKSEDIAALHAPPALIFVTSTPIRPTPPPPQVFLIPTPLPTSLSPAVSVSPPPASDAPAPLRIRGLEVTQGIQVFGEPENSRCNPDLAHPDYIFCNNSIPLVAGRNTMARLYLACADQCPVSDVVVNLRLLKNGQEQANLTRTLPAAALQQVNTMPLNEVRVNLGRSVNFEFTPPPEWLADEVTFEVSAAPEGLNAVGVTMTHTFVQRKPLRVAYLPIQYQGLMPPDPDEVAYWLLRMYPVPGVEYYRLPAPDLVWDGELNKGDILRKLLYFYWLYAQNRPPEQWPDQLFGWLPQEFYNGGISDPFWCPQCIGPHSSRVAFGGLRPETDIGGPRILVHEIAHNLGAQHAWSPTQREDGACFKAEGADIQVDPTWPYAQTPLIQEVGLDLYSQPPIVYPPSFYDMMAYCTQPWISPYTYRRLFDSPFLQPDAPTRLALTNFKPQVETGDNGTLLVSGIVYPDGSVSRPEVVRLEGQAALSFTPPSGQDYCLSAQNNSGATVAQHCFAAGFLDLETGQKEPTSYFLTLPDAAQVTLSKNQVALEIVAPSQSPPQVQVISPNGGETLSGQQLITWEASDPDGDPLTYDLLYSLDNGQTWLPMAVRVSQTSYPFYTDQLSPTQEALIRVMANDGFNTAFDQSDGPFTIAAPVENSLSLRGPALVKSGQTFEMSVLGHQITGLFGAQFKLNFDPARVQVDRLRLHPDLNLVVDQTIDNAAGQVSVIASRRGQVDNLTGNLTLATFTLTARASGQTALFLTDVTAGARGGARLNLAPTPGASLRIVQP